MEFEAADFSKLYSVGSDMVLPGQTTLSPYWRTDASVRVSYRQRIYLALAGTNLTDAVYKESGNAKAPGRIVAVKIGANI